MGVSNSWRQTTTMDGWMRDIEKRLMHEERRPSVRPAEDVVGPGFRPYAVEAKDWNSEGPIVGGHYYSMAGQVVNSPDDTKHWIGIVQSNPFGQGVQRVWEYLNDVDDDANPETPPTQDPNSDPTIYTRSFVTNTDGTRDYSEWVASTGGGGGGGAPTGPAGGDLTGTYPNPTIGPNKVTSSHIADGTIALGDLSTAAIQGLRVDVKDEGVSVQADATEVNFVGAGVSATGAAGVATVTIPGGINGILIRDEGSTIAPEAQALNFYGAGVTATPTAGNAAIEVTGEPKGAAGGDLTGTYPNPTIGLNKVTNAHLADGAVNLATADVTGTLPISKGGTGAADVNNAKINLGYPRWTVVNVPALTAGVWTTVNHGLGTTPPLSVSFAYQGATGEAVELDWRKKDSNNIEIKADLAFGVSTLSMMVVA